MYRHGHLIAGVAIVLLGTACATPAPAPAPAPVSGPAVMTPVVKREPASPTDPWVSVDTSGHPRTITPVMTTISGMPTLLSPAPNDLTGTVFTQTNYGEVTTSTGGAPEPTATGADGAGAFPVCKKPAGSADPFCAPAANSTLNPGATYYITWDPSIFPAPNTTLTVQGNYFNATTGAILSQAFASDRLAAAWSFYAWPVDTSLMTGGRPVNITLQIAAVVPGATAPNITAGPTVTVANPPGYKPVHTQPPTGPALYIGLPTVLAFVAVVLCGTFLWNRRARHIGLGNVMGRGRGGYGVAKSRASRLATGRQRREQKEGIQLVEREIWPEEGQQEQQLYRDMPTQDLHNGGGGGGGGGGWSSWEQRSPAFRQDHSDGSAGRPRRDSDCLGSLAGTPTEDREMDFPRPQPGGTNNAFRTELERQNRDRKGF